MKHFDPATIPARMQHLDRDKRGLPIPFVVLRDSDNRPHFTINDSDAVDLVISDKRCSICGKHLNGNIWMIGGPLSAIHKHGAYIDPPVHKDCGTFALKTCPYIALPSWSETKRIDDKTLDREKVPAHLLLVDKTMIPERPAFFIFAKTTGLTVSGFPGSYHLHPRRPWLQMEFWKDGEPIDQETARALFIENQGEAPETHAYWPQRKSK